MQVLRSTILCRLLLTATLACSAWPAVAVTQVLYDADNPPLANFTPTTPGWLANGLFGLTEIVSPQGTELVPGPFGNSAVGGYSNHFSTLELSPLQVKTGALVNATFPVLERTTGYALDLGFRVLAEDHSINGNRAGFSITLIGSDLMGIEIGFQSNRIFAQETGAGTFFTAAENTVDVSALGLLSDYHRWTLGVGGNNYTLSQGGINVLTGALRNYSGYTGLGEDAYRTPNFLFFGDNTTSAGSTYGINYAAITTPVPEPSSLALLAGGLIVVVAAVRRRRFHGSLRMRNNFSGRTEN